MNNSLPAIDLSLVEMLCARLCHDLAGTIGGITAGAELLAEEYGGTGNESLDLLLASANAASIRLQFLRYAFGGGEDEMRSEQLLKVMQNYLAASAMGGRYKLSWPEESARRIIAANDSRLLFNIILVAKDCLPKGGVITIHSGKSEIFPGTIEVHGNGILLGISASFMIGKEENILVPRSAQGRYARLLATQCGYDIGLEQADGVINFHVQVA